MALGFTEIKKYFDDGKWNAEMVYVAVEQEVITAEQYKTITDEEYVPTPYKINGGILTDLARAGLIEGNTENLDDDTSGSGDDDQSGGGGSGDESGGSGSGDDEDSSGTGGE